MKKHLSAILLTIAVVLIGYSLYLYLQRGSKKQVEQPQQPTAERRTKEIYNFDPTLCPGIPIDFVVKDPYMRGIVEVNQTVKITMNYYACNQLKKGDIVLYKYSQYEEPVIRRVVAVPGDKFKLRSVPREGWELSVNGNVITGVNGQPYRFGVDKYDPPLELAGKQRNFVLPAKELIVLSSFPPGDRDGGIFGLSNQNDIVGKVEVSSEETK